VYIANPPAGGQANPAQSAQPATTGGTEADRLHEAYKSLGQAQGHDYGDNPPGTKPVDFTKLGAPAGATPPPAATPGQPPKPGQATPPGQAPPSQNPPPDSARRSNQAAGGPPGGQDR
jgi:hypothetical protein